MNQYKNPYAMRSFPYVYECDLDFGHFGEKPGNIHAEISSNGQNIRAKIIKVEALINGTWRNVTHLIEDFKNRDNLQTLVEEGYEQEQNCRDARASEKAERIYRMWVESCANRKCE